LRVQTEYGREISSKAKYYGETDSEKVQYGKLKRTLKIELKEPEIV
jgi:hypothetical protein